MGPSGRQVKPRFAARGSARRHPQSPPAIPLGKAPPPAALHTPACTAPARGVPGAAVPSDRPPGLTPRACRKRHQRDLFVSPLRPSPPSRPGGHGRARTCSGRGTGKARRGGYNFPARPTAATAPAAPRDFCGAPGSGGRAGGEGAGQRRRRLPGGPRGRAGR